MKFSPENVENVLSLGQTFGLRLLPLFTSDQTKLYALLEAIEDVMYSGFINLLKDPDLRAILHSKEEETFAEDTFVFSDSESNTQYRQVVHYLSSLTRKLREFRFPDEIDGMSDIPLRILLVNDKKFAAACVLPTGTIIVGKGLLLGVDYRELVSILLHEIEHFESWDFTVVLQALPAFLAAMPKEITTNEVIKLVTTVNNYIEHRSKNLEVTADRGAIMALRCLGYQPGTMATALTTINKLLRKNRTSLLEIMGSENHPPLIETHPPLSVRLEILEEIEREIDDLQSQNKLPYFECSGFENHWAAIREQLR